MNAALPADEPIGENPFKFWRARFEAAFRSPSATRHTRAWERAVGVAMPVSDEQRAARRAIDERREAADAALEEAATRAYEELTADARAALERQAREELNAYRERMMPDAFATSVRVVAIRYLKDELRAQQRKQG